LVTGATSGIGRAYAEALAARGYDLLVTGRREAVLSGVADGIRDAFGVRVSTLVGDLAQGKTQAQVLNEAAAAPVAWVVNNAGFGMSNDLADADPEQLQAMLAVHAEFPLALMQCVLPAMRSAGSGVIVNVGSLAGRVAVPGSSLYVATKSYLERLSESLALELAPNGIVVQALLPGYVRTDFHRHVPDARAKQRNRGMIRWMEAKDVVGHSLRVADRARRRVSGEGVRLPRPRDVVVIPGVANRFLAGLGRVVPLRVVYAAASKRPQLR
jgi:short-subunit dehydrogenase